MPTTSKTRKTRKRKRRTRSEAKIQRTILNWLKTTGLLHWRQNSGLLFFGKRRIILGAAGLPDIIVVLPPTGKLVGLEVKSAKGKLRPSQEAMRDRFQATGATYHVVRTLLDAMNALGWVKR